MLHSGATTKRELGTKQYMRCIAPTHSPSRLGASVRALVKFASQERLEERRPRSRRRACVAAAALAARARWQGTVLPTGRAAGTGAGRPADCVDGAEQSGA